MIEAMTALDHAISLAKRLREISKNAAEAEFKNVLADLLGELADAKIQIAELKTRLAART